MIKVNLDVGKIDKTALFKGKKGTYCDLTLMWNKGGEDEYGNHGFVVQDLGKERRLAGEKGPILGNFKDWDKEAKPAASGGSAPPADDGDDIPFAPHKEAF